MSQYLLLLHETPADSARITPAEMQEIIAAPPGLGRRAGAERPAAQRRETHRRRRPPRCAWPNGRPLASDGPYAEAHDVIGGFYLVQAENDLAAEAIAADCPHLEGRQWIELRRIEVMG